MLFKKTDMNIYRYIFSIFLPLVAKQNRPWPSGKMVTGQINLIKYLIFYKCRFTALFSSAIAPYVMLSGKQKYLKRN